MKLFHRISTAAVLGASMLSLAIAPANAAACRDAHGRFAKCATTAAATARPAHATKVASAAVKSQKTASAPSAKTATAAPAAKMASMTPAAKRPHTAKKAAATHAG